MNRGGLGMGKLVGRGVRSIQTFGPNGVTLGQTSFSRFFFSQMTSRAVHYDVIHHPFPSQFSIFEDVGSLQPCNIPYSLVLHTPKWLTWWGTPRPVTQSVFTTHEGNKTTGNFKQTCTNSPVSYKLWPKSLWSPFLFSHAHFFCLLKAKGKKQIAGSVK